MPAEPQCVFFRPTYGLCTLCKWRSQSRTIAHIKAQEKAVHLLEESFLAWILCCKVWFTIHWESTGGTPLTAALVPYMHANRSNWECQFGNHCSDGLPGKLSKGQLAQWAADDADSRSHTGDTKIDCEPQLPVHSVNYSKDFAIVTVFVIFRVCRTCIRRKRCIISTSR